METKHTESIVKIDKKKELPSNKIQTHLYLNNKYLTAINKLNGYEKLNVLYLHNNEISKIENLQNITSLSNLYLQKNCLEKIENVETLVQLKRLYIGNNSISVVENLDTLINLEELHIERQNLNKGESLCFNPKTIMSISDNLQILNISYNNITNISYLLPLRFLKVLIASHNNLNKLDDVLNTIKNWYYVTNITFVGNPICKQHRYKENIIANTCRLNMLDEKTISENTRCFIKRFESHKQNNASRHSINLSDTFPNLPNNYAPSLQKAVSSSIMKKSFHDFAVNPNVVPQNVNKYIPWKALSSTSRLKTPLRNKRKSDLPTNTNILHTTFPQF